MTLATASSRQWSSWLLPASFVLHVVVVVSLFLLALLMPEPLPPAAPGIRAFLVEPVVVAPPPPPAALAPSTRTVRRRTHATSEPSAPALTAPLVTSERIVTDEPLDLGFDAAGDVEGVEGGVPGGVVGGIVGGLPASPPPPPAPVRLEEGVREPRKVKHVAPRYPEIAARANIRGAVVLECLVSPEGGVAKVTVLRTSNPLLDGAAIEAVKQWLYTPTLVDGVPVPVIFKVTVQFNLE